MWNVSENNKMFLLCNFQSVILRTGKNKPCGYTGKFHTVYFKKELEITNLYTAIKMGKQQKITVWGKWIKEENQ